MWRIDVASGRAEIWREIPVGDFAGVESVSNIQITPDGKSLAYGLRRTISELYLAHGFRSEILQWIDPVLVSTSDRFSAAQIRSTYQLRSAIEERHRQYKCFWDLTRMHSCAFSLVVNQALFVLLTYTLVQAHLVLRQRQALTSGVWERAWQLLSPSLEVVAVYYRQRFCLLTLAEFGGILLDIAEPARGKLRERLRRIEREQYSSK